MDNTDFAVLVGRLERESDRRPKVHSSKVALVAAAGYAPLALFALLLLAACGFAIASLLSGQPPGVFTIVAAVVALAGLGGTIRALWIEPQPPAGKDLLREDAPALFAAIDELVQKMATSRKGRTHIAGIDWVTLDREFNLSIQQCALRGVFGDYSNHLRVGVPLLMALSIAEFKTILAHEIGHLGAVHNRFSAWIYRQRDTWMTLLQRFEEPDTIFERMLAPFYRRYIPYFHAYTFLLARNHEYAADRAAVRATNARVLARALIKIELIGRFLAEVFWKRLFDQVEKVPEPQYLPYSVMPRALTVAQKEWQRPDWLHSALRRYAGDADAHPPLGERLAALDVEAELPKQVSEKSALALLGDVDAVLRQCDAEWSAEYVPAWRKRHNVIREAHWKIAQYDNTPTQDLKPEQLWEKSQLLLDVAREHEAIETLQALVALNAKAAQAQFLLG
ncbi:MAG TPA: M48 family metallopeptidase, partial [Povalibacter sp.]|nr:M48 family metallopeptidase [Povalibacter sp.]